MFVVCMDGLRDLFPRTAKLSGSSVPLGFASAKNVCLHVIPWRAEVFKSDAFSGVLGVSQTQVSETLKTRENNGRNWPKMDQNVHCEVSVTYPLGLESL